MKREDNKKINNDQCVFLETTNMRNLRVGGTIVKILENLMNLMKMEKLEKMEKMEKIKEDDQKKNDVEYVIGESGLMKMTKEGRLKY